MGAKKVERPVEPCFLNAAPRLYTDLTWVLWILWTGPGRDLMMSLEGRSQQAEGGLVRPGPSGVESSPARSGRMT